MRSAAQAMGERQLKCGIKGCLAVVVTAASCVCVLVGSVRAGDWPQILGPNRNGVAIEERIALSWPGSGLKSLWQREVGSGFAGVAVTQGKAVLFHRIGEQEIVEAMEALTGKVVWKAAFAARYSPSYTDDDGPRAVPVLAGNRVYTYGALGDLRCLNLSTGKLLWERNTYDEFNSKRPFRGEPPEGYFGMASSPIVEGDKVLINVGGDAKGAGIVAFAADTGKTLWTATDERASYSSPLAVTIDGVRHVIVVTRLNVLSLNPDTGKIRFRFPFGRLGPTVSAAGPVVVGEHLFVTASYGIGSAWVKVGEDRAEVLWRDPQILASQYTTCVEKDGHLFGIHGRQDGPPAALRCIDPRTRRVLWTESAFGYATLIRVGDHLLILKTDGTLVLAKANAARYEELARTRVCENTTRALPALCNGLLYVA